MVFLKPLEDLKFADIEGLKTNRICESQILDYKEQLLVDNKLLKQVSAFANTQGGFLVFGVKETGKGGYPKKILGIDKSQINKERLEQIILGNIQPRLNVKIQIIDHQESSKAIVVIQIPNSYLKPHMNARDNKFYKRYEFEAPPMTEIEVSDTYGRRFTGYQELESYMSKLLELEEPALHPIVGQIIVIPTILRRMIGTHNIKEFDWIGKINLKPKYPSVFTYLRRESPTPSPNGVTYQNLDKDANVFAELEIHRNGCIHSMGYFGVKDEDKTFFHALDFCVTLSHILQFASTLYQRCNYFGDVKVACNLGLVEDSWLRFPSNTRRLFDMPRDHPCRTDEISISREFPTKVVESEYEYVISGIMDVIFNCYGFWKCPLFDDEGKFKKSISK